MSYLVRLCSFTDSIHSIPFYSHSLTHSEYLLLLPLDAGRRPKEGGLSQVFGKKWNRGRFDQRQVASSINGMVDCL